MPVSFGPRGLRPRGPVSMPGKCLFQASASFPPRIPQPWGQIKATTGWTSMDSARMRVSRTSICVRKNAVRIFLGPFLQRTWCFFCMYIEGHWTRASYHSDIPSNIPDDPKAKPRGFPWPRSYVLSLKNGTATSRVWCTRNVDASCLQSSAVLNISGLVGWANLDKKQTFCYWLQRSVL